MSRLYVCSLARLAETAQATGAASLLTLLSPTGVRAVRPPGITADRHLVVGVSDIVAPKDGYTHPDTAHVEDLLRFFRSWDREAPLLIHCYAGVSRSTAAAFMAVCALAPERSEDEIADALRHASPTATPNQRLVALADVALGRSDRMVRAVQRIGRGAECSEGEPFGLDIQPPAA